MGDFILKILIVFYIILTIAYIVDGKYAHSLYWIGAIILSIGLLFMK